MTVSDHKKGVYRAIPIVCTYSQLPVNSLSGSGACNWKIAQNPDGAQLMEPEDPFSCLVEGVMSRYFKRHTRLWKLGNKFCKYARAAAKERLFGCFQNSARSKLL